MLMLVGLTSLPPLHTPTSPYLIQQVNVAAGEDHSLGKLSLPKTHIARTTQCHNLLSSPTILLCPSSPL